MHIENNNIRFEKYLKDEEEAEKNEMSLPFNSEKEIKFLFFGDMMLDRHVGEKIKSKGIHYLFEKLDENDFFQNYDLISVNLEGVVTDGGAHYAPHNLYDFAFSPEIINQLKDYNFNFFNLANNHFGDQGQRGIIETRKNLDNLGFYYSGCQDGKTGDCSFEIIEMKGKKIGLAGFSQVYSLIEISKMENIILDLASRVDFVIVNIHWGLEYQHQFNQTQQKYAHSLIDSGADIIIGHHPHVVQGMEIYKNKPIFYSLGNFVFDQYFSQATQEGLSVGISITEDKKEFNLFPFKSKASQPYLMNDNEWEMFIKKFISWSDLSSEEQKQVLDFKIIID